MTTTTIKNAQGRVMGQIRTVGGRPTVFNASGRNLGSYDARTNMTLNSSGRIVTTGNTLTNFLKE